MNVLLRDGEPPTDYFKTYVALIEKCPQVARARDLRPINLMEVLNKLFMGLLTTRLQPTVPNYSCQFAGRPGHQTLDALSTAHHMVDRETKWNKSSVWISLDVSAAFDSLALSQVGAFLHEEVGPQCRWEALRMFQFMKHSHLEFHYMGQQWSVDQTSGVQQGVPTALGSSVACWLGKSTGFLSDGIRTCLPPFILPMASCTLTTYSFACRTGTRQMRCMNSCRIR